MNPVFPSILSTDYFDLEDKLRQFEKNKIDFIHLDVMDCHFVENISFVPAAVKAIKAKYKFNVDSHLMVSDPGRMIPWFAKAGSDWISIHIETGQTKEHIAAIKKNGAKAGLVLNPDSDIESVFPYLKDIDYVLLMSVYPGFGGQEFIASTLEKVSRLKKEIQRVGDCLIQVDGGVNLENAGALKAAGNDLFVIGTYLYGSGNIKQTLTEILNQIDGA